MVYLKNPFFSVGTHILFLKDEKKVKFVFYIAYMCKKLCTFANVIINKFVYLVRINLKNSKNIVYINIFNNKC